MLLAVLAAVVVAQPGEPSRVYAEPADGGAALMVRFECSRCHELPPNQGAVAPSPGEKQDCAGCHRRMKNDVSLIFDRRTPPPNIQHWLDVPALDGAVKHVKPSWIAGFLQAPHDVRPGLEESMPRLPLTAAQAAAIAKFLSQEAEEGAVAWPASATVERGKQLVQERGCFSCHVMSGSGIAGGSLPRAPDLRHARARMTPATIVKWLSDPAAMMPGTAMPKPALDDNERLAVARFLVESPLAPGATTAPKRLPVLDKKKVGWKDVQPILKPCVHCHDDVVVAKGEGGPGNTGGFGFAAAGLDLSSYSAVVRARSRGKSVVEPVGGFPPLLVQALLRRQQEHVAEQNGVVEPMAPSAPRGMPLGLPPLTPEQIQLVETWLAQDMPR